MKKIDEDLAEVFGIHIGDGCISRNKRYSEFYIGGDLKEEKEYHDSWVSYLYDKKIMLPILNRNISYKEYPKVGVCGSYNFNKEIVEFFESYELKPGSKINIRVPNGIMNNERLSKRFLRGLFDTDGNIYFDKNRSSKTPINKVPVIKLGCVSKKLIYDVYVILKNLKLNPRMKKPYKGKGDKNYIYTILIYRKKDIEFFINEIGFKNPKHYTKWQVFRKLGYCLPRTTLNQRKKILMD